MMYHFPVCIAWFVSICGVCGKTASILAGKEVNVHVMVACTIRCTGKAFAGPASLQAPPSNVLAKLDFETDGDGNIWI